MEDRVTERNWNCLEPVGGIMTLLHFYQVGLDTLKKYKVPRGHKVYSSSATGDEVT